MVVGARVATGERLFVGRSFGRKGRLKVSGETGRRLAALWSSKRGLRDGRGGRQQYRVLKLHDMCTHLFGLYKCNLFDLMTCGRERRRTPQVDFDFAEVSYDLL